MLAHAAKGSSAARPWSCGRGWALCGRQSWQCPASAMGCGCPQRSRLRAARAVTWCGRAGAGGAIAPPARQ
ncbi:hypothetical protein XOC_4507 [Xanthomonas oryzae pv. oryzicola BLS256]|uniref:Uncharacterized protein n=1 Tax=Xanthomonas oryzae pv. oryzicola (strain BLS256) TaxID=383407 RepID=G7TB59_XANOB|nr:hypothetical protein XOC_4507 [Xanthomonas oryzae pv. oryzicola BLS256]